MQSPVNTGGATSLFLAFIAKTFLKLIRHVASLKGVPVVVISLLKGSLTRYFLLHFLYSASLLSHLLKGPMHEIFGFGFFYINQTYMDR